PASGSQFPLGSTTVVVVATDAAGNAATSSFVVAVVDTTAPAITCPADQTFEATSAAGAPVDFTPATATDAVSTPAIDYSPAQGSQLPLGTSAVTATAADDAGNTAQCTFQVTVQDTTAPALSLPADQTFDAQSGAGAVVTYVPATATDAVSTPVLVHTPAPGTQFPMGVTTVSVTATDAAGNTSTGSFTVTVSDLSPPALSCPANQTFEATSGAGTTVSYTPATATDAISTPVVSHTPPSGGTFPLGSTQVTAVATDAAGNSASCTFSVIVRDTTAPQLSVPADQTFEATSAAGAVVSYTPATATDAVSTPTVTHDPVSGSQFPLGPTLVQVTAVDGAGNSAAGSFTVRVVDTTAPAITCPANRVFEAASAAGAVVSFTPATATDAVSSVTPAHSPASQTSFPLGVTTVTAVAQDAAGNSASCTFTVTVADTTAPSVSCPGDQVVEATGAAGATVSYPAVQASDPVSTPTLAYSQAPGSQFGLGQTAVTVTATDAAGNAASCSFAVTVQDTTPPALTCPADVTVDGTNSGAAVTYPDAVATDAVSTPAVTYGQASGSTFPAGTTPVTVTATDGARNTSTCTFTVTVNAPPGGCGCQATGGVAPLGWALAMVLARVALRRRARWIRR
ncbi:MAG TPA: HYR domain-containing protein, partial [Myxococcales bacterium]|nr:HYR domain-containing protein [Myxococcales bacterium]